MAFLIDSFIKATIKDSNWGFLQVFTQFLYVFSLKQMAIRFCNIIPK